MARILLATLVIGILTPLSSLQAESPAVLLERGIYAEQTKGDVDAAMAIYKTILKDAKANRPFLAQAKYRLGMCLLKKKKSTEATAVFQELITKYPEKKDLVAKAHTQIANSRKKITGAELQAIVRKAVMTISTCAEADPRVKKTLATLEGLKEAETVKAIAKFISSDKNTVRRSAIYILWKGPFDSIAPAEAGLIKACSNPEGLTRGMAALTLGGRKVKAAFKPLCDMTLNDKSPFARRCGAYALGLLGDQKAVPILQKALKDKEEFVVNNAQAALTLLKMDGADGELSWEVLKYIYLIQMQTVTQAKKQNLKANAHVYGVDDKFRKNMGGFLAAHNDTALPIQHEMSLGNFDGTEFDLYDDMGVKQKFRMIDRKVSKGGRYRLMWTPNRPLEAGETRLLGWKNARVDPLKKGEDGFYHLRMSNHLGAKGIENFFMVVPAGMKIVSETSKPISRKQIGMFDVYLYQREVTAKTNNTVDVVLSLNESKTADQRASAQFHKRGWFSFNQGNMPEAQKLFRQAVTKNPMNANAWNGLGWALQNQGKKEAKRAFEKCLVLDPKNPGALNGMGWLAKSAGNSDKAIGWWEKAVKANPSATAAWKGLTQTLEERKQYHHAAVCYAAWLRAEPNNEKLKAKLSDMMEKSKAVLEETRKAKMAADAWLKLLDEGKYAESWADSATLFQKAITKKKWVSTIGFLCGELGKVKSRKKLSADYRTSLPGAPDGEYVIFTFKTTFEKKKDAIETVTPMKGKDGKWHVSGYYVK